MGGFNPNTTPTDSKVPLVKDANVKTTQYQYRWKYASVIVILMSVASKSHLKIAFDVTSSQYSPITPSAHMRNHF